MSNETKTTETETVPIPGADVKRAEKLGHIAIPASMTNETDTRDVSLPDAPFRDMSQALDAKPKFVEVPSVGGQVQISHELPPVAPTPQIGSVDIGDGRPPAPWPHR